MIDVNIKQAPSLDDVNTKYIPG